MRQVPQSEPRSSKKKEEQDTPQSTELPPSRGKGSRIPTKRRPGAAFGKMGEEIQVGHTPTPSENTKNHTRTGIERAIRGGRHRNITRKKENSGILNTFKESVPEVGTVLGTKDENYKESYQNLQDCVLQYVVENYKKGVDLAPLISRLEDVDLSSN